MMSADTTSLADRQILRDTVRSFLEKYSPEPEIRRVMASEEGFDRTMWSRMAEELGLQGLAVPVDYGGIGYGVTELQVVLEELGRSLACSPFLSSAVLATSVILASGDDDACHQYLPDLCSGARIATVAFAVDGFRWETGNWGCVATREGDGYRLTGQKSFVLDAQAVDLLLVVADTESGPSVFAVVPTANVEVTAMENLDATRRMSSVRMDAAEGRLLGPLGGAAEIVAPALVTAGAALAAEQIGGARRALELAVEYARVRKQFGRFIGSFQAIKQKCSDVLMAVESATSAAYAAGSAIDQNSSESVALAYLALSQASEAYVFAATENIEVHGGIGFTWEHPAHLFYKRAIATSVLFGSPSMQRARMLTALAR